MQLHRIEKESNNEKQGSPQREKSKPFAWLKTFRLLTSIISDMLQLYSSILDELPSLSMKRLPSYFQPTRDSNAYRFRQLDTVLNGKAYTKKMFYLHTWSRNKSSCDTSNVFWNFLELSTDEHSDEMKKKNWRRKIQAEKFTNLFFSNLLYWVFLLPPFLFPRRQQRTAVKIYREN